MKKEENQDKNRKREPFKAQATDPHRQDRSVSQDSLKAFAGNSINADKNRDIVSEPDKTAQKAQSDCTIKKEQIITTKLRNLHLSLKEIAPIVHCSYSHARHVWAKYQRETAQNRGGPSPPFSFHGSWKENTVPVSWLKVCPLDLSKNVNGQRVWKGSKTTMVFHRNGKIMVYAYHDGWEQEAREFLSGFWSIDQIESFILSLEDRGMKSVALDTPKVPRNFKIKVRGVGTLQTDTTPYPDGTTEFEFDPEILKRMSDMERFLAKFLGFIQSMGMTFEKVQQQNIRSLETDAQIIKQNTEAIQSFNQFMKDLSAPRSPPKNDRSVV